MSRDEEGIIALFFRREDKASLIFCRLWYDIFEYEGWVDCDNNVYDKAPPALFYSNKGSRIFHYTFIMGPHNYIFNLMPIYIFIYLFVCLVDDVGSTWKGWAHTRFFQESYLQFHVCGRREREIERACWVGGLVKTSVFSFM